jgi:heme A synthase
MPDPIDSTRPVPRWVHAWAVLTVIATAGLLALGGVVTTFRVGMADPIWPTSPWYLFFISWREPSAGFLIEHSHRLAGYVVGCCVIVLALGLWFTAKAGWLRKLGVVALAAVIVQGLLGGFRVKLNALVGTDLAAIHGCFAQVVFSLLVSLAVLTARRRNELAIDAEAGRRLYRLGLLFSALVFAQLVWGALVRHSNGSLAQRAHLLTAFAVVATAAWFVKGAIADPTMRTRLGVALSVLCGLLMVQVMLGVEAWLGKFGTGVLPELQTITLGQAAVRTAHMLVGSWVLATVVVLTLQARGAGVPGVESQTEAIQASQDLLRGSAASRISVHVTHQLEGTP